MTENHNGINFNSAQVFFRSPTQILFPSIAKPLRQEEEEEEEVKNTKLGKLLGWPNK